MLKGTLRSFYAVKHLWNVFQAAALGIVKYKTLAQEPSPHEKYPSAPYNPLNGRLRDLCQAILLHPVRYPSYATELKFLPYQTI